MNLSTDFHGQHDFSSLLSRVRLTADAASQALGKLHACAPWPTDAVGLSHVCAGAVASVTAALTFLSDPNPTARLIASDLLALTEQIAAVAPDAFNQELAAPRGRRLLKFCGWRMLMALGQKGVSQACLIAGGLLFMHSWVSGKKIPKAQALVITGRCQHEGLSPDGLLGILQSEVDAEALGHPWLSQIQRLWPKLKNLFARQGGDGPPEPPSFNHRARGRLMAAAEFPSAAHRAGTADHRHLSDGQFALACAQVADWLEADDWRGVYANTAALSPLTADMLGDIPLASALQESPVVQIDDQAAFLQVDCSCLAKEAARPPAGANVIASAYVATTHYSARAAANLRARRLRYPDARTLSELYPDAPRLTGDMALVETTGEITLSWARWINSFGLYMRRARHDNFIVGVVTKDFGHGPKSKLFYATVAREEIWASLNAFYQSIVWGGAEPDRMGGVNFGCRVVPPTAAVLGANRSLVVDMQRMRVAKRDSLEKLLEFHNRYVRVIALPLIVLFALREDKPYDLWADIDERDDLWVEIFDKVLPGPQGALPVPLCPFARKVIKSFRMHCRAVAWRLRTQGYGNTSLYHWLKAVWERERVHLLCLASSANCIAPVGTSDVVGRLAPQHWLAPDVGRKLLENEGRRRGLRTGDVDALLRHEVDGQGRSTSASDFVLLDWLRRVTPVLDQIAHEAFGEVVSGLSEE